MKLTQEQIQELYAFTRKHFVEHYDLQTELVDHLANGIEQQILENSNLSFQEALNNEFKSFGVFGFQDVITEKQRALSKHYWKIIFKFYKGFFKLPKIILTLGLSYLLFFILKISGIEHHNKVLFFVFILFLIPTFFKMFALRKEFKKKKEKWML